MDTLLDQRSLSRLKWGCRRGMLENDLLIADFFERHERSLSVRQSHGLMWLMELPDNDLLDLLLRRSELPTGLGRPEVSEVLMLLRRPVAAPFTGGRTP